MSTRGEEDGMDEWAKLTQDAVPVLFVLTC